MTRDWKTTYAAASATTQHTITFPQPASAGHRLVAFASSAATIALPAGWTEHAGPVGTVGELSGASRTAAGGETSLTWGRDPGSSLSPRSLAGWAESRDDVGGLHGTPLVYNGVTIGLAETFTLDPIVTAVDGCRIYLALSTFDNPWPWVPSVAAPLTVENVVAANGYGYEKVRLAVISGVAPTAGSYAITVSGLPEGGRFQIVAFALAPAGGGGVPPAQTAVEAENRLTGTMAWDVDGAGHPSIQGFATAMNVTRGSTLTLKVHSPNSAWTGKVYRLGYYGGQGGREVDSVSGAQTSQPTGTTDPTTGMVSCANWSANGSWSVPATAAAGVYVIKIARTDNPAMASHIGPFVVTDPGRKAAIAVKLSDSTWQAYNHAGANPAAPFDGKSIYGIGTQQSWSWNNDQRTRAVSYDRPLVTRLHLPQTTLWNAEYPLLRWLERLGYDVDYLTCAQVDVDPSLLLGRAAVISSGHDEYWSAGMRDAFVGARDSSTARSHLLFMSGNEAFWRIRWNTDRRSYACWKDSLDGQLNPTGQYSGTWQDTRPFNTDRRPAALLTGTRFRLNGVNAFRLSVPATYAASPLWRNTAVAALGTGQTWDSPPGIVGFEADEPADTSATERPAGLIRLSQLSVQIDSSLADDNGAAYVNSGTFGHALTAYRNTGTGAAVFGFGTCQYAWGLDDVHERSGTSAVSPVLQQALVNLLADLGAVPPAYPFPAGLVRPTPVALSTYWPPASAPTAASAPEQRTGHPDESDPLAEPATPPTTI
ncbi:N,N-dimethylformamidase beta subunit family domain-containing protein [Micromonospora zhanjiangensis]|uniref:N,N-dimethylformamidase beta subunit family domain-containing protein n=1 Tax=Micromonospora zhanjiangensis TaxID=1522057 RepID=A0ABV8KM77_9ACTN